EILGLVLVAEASENRKPMAMLWIALRALLEDYNIGTTGVCKGSSGAVAYQQTVLEFPGRVVAAKLRHDAHVSASSYVFEYQASGRLEGRKELAQNS
ncbi:hypothetical protein EVAR_73702_1, partial [Eumeta japonica]